MNPSGGMVSTILARAIWVDAVLLVVLAIALVTDIRDNKVYNWLTFPSILFGLIVNAVLGGWVGLHLLKKKHLDQNQLC